MKYVPGLMVGQLSGKAGSTVASRNRGGSYFRTRTIPKKIVNPYTTAVRENFGSNAQGYGLLQDGQRAAWIALGAQVVNKNSLGVAHHLTGSQAFQMINRNLFSISLPPVSDAPAFSAPADLGAISFTSIAGGAGTTTVTSGAASATQVVGSTTNMYVGAVIHNVTQGYYATVESVTDATHVVFTAPITTVTADVLDWTEKPTIALDFSLTPLPADTYLLVEATAPLSPGVNAPSKGEFRQIDVIAPAATSPQALGLAYFAKFGLPPIGSKIFIRARLISGFGFAGPIVVNSALTS